MSFYKKIKTKKNNTFIQTNKSLNLYEISKSNEKNNNPFLIKLSKEIQKNPKSLAFQKLQNISKEIFSNCKNPINNISIDLLNSYYPFAQTNINNNQIDLMSKTLKPSNSDNNFIRLNNFRKSTRKKTSFNNMSNLIKTPSMKRSQQINLENVLISKSINKYLNDINSELSKFEDKNENDPKTSKKASTATNFYIKNNIFPQNGNLNNQKTRVITRYLDRKKINDVPVIYPLYLNYKNNFNTHSEKSRIEKILNKFISLKTNIKQDPLNAVPIIKEFLSRNGINKPEYYTDQRIDNLYNYLKKPFSFNSTNTLLDSIKEASNFDPSILLNNKKDIEVKPINYVGVENINKNNSHTMKKNYSSPNIFSNKVKYSLAQEEIYRRVYLGNIKNKKLENLIDDLENELKKIKIDKMAKLEKYNYLKDVKNFGILKKNTGEKTFITNLCLSGKWPKQHGNKNNNNYRVINKIKSKKDQLKEINNRLYYNMIRKKNARELDREDIQKKLKLTEFVVLERSKKNLIFQDAKKELLHNSVNVIF